VLVVGVAVEQEALLAHQGQVVVAVVAVLMFKGYLRLPALAQQKP
jgi:hypothetical protein